MCNYKGKEYVSDVARIINKFDICICDLGAPTGNNLGKERPCVIIQSNKFNEPKQPTYIVAPIRSEHELEVSDNNLDNIVDYRRKLGRLYIPIKFSPTKTSFIDMTRMRSVYHTEVLVHKFSIINEDLKKSINDAMYELLFAEDDYDYQLVDHNKDMEDIQVEQAQIEFQKEYNNIQTECDRVHKEIQEKSEIFDKEYENIKNEIQMKEPVQPVTVLNLSDIYKDVASSKMTMGEGASTLGINLSDFINLVEKYEEDEASKFDKWYKENHKSNNQRQKTPGLFIRLYTQKQNRLVGYNDFIELLEWSNFKVYKRITSYEEYLSTK